MQAQASILVLPRVYGLYDRSRCVLGVLVFSFVITTGAAAWNLSASHHAGGEAIPVKSSFPGCAEYMPRIGGRCKLLY
ncbi:hypothetical protein BJV74DRAFT_871086 [Russula compacta]|nr:hypothetical protein BJV74DRAFT_871086 [Russula compacta]